MATNVGILSRAPQVTLPTSLTGPVDLGVAEAYPAYDWGFGGGCEYNADEGISGCGMGDGGEWSVGVDGYFQQCPDDYYQEIDSYAICDGDNLIFSENDCGIYGDDIGACYDPVNSNYGNVDGVDGVGWDDSVECGDNFGAPCGFNGNFDGMCARDVNTALPCNDFVDDVPDPTLTEASSFPDSNTESQTKTKTKTPIKTKTLAKPTAPVKTLAKSTAPVKTLAKSTAPVKTLAKPKVDRSVSSQLVTTASRASKESPLVTTATVDDPVSERMDDFVDDLAETPLVSTSSKKSQKSKSQKRSKSKSTENIPDDISVNVSNDVSEETKTAELFSHDDTSESRYTLAVMSSNKFISILTLHDYSVKDVCGFDNSIFILLNNGNILQLVPNGSYETQNALLKGDYEITPIENNVRLQQILTFGGYLYGVSKGELYLLDSRTYNSVSWNWDSVSWAPSNISDARTTLIGDHLFLTAEDTGYLYSIEGTTHQNPTLVEESDLGGKQRIYGSTPENYLEINPSKNIAIKRPDNEKVTNIKIGALTYDGDIIRISPSLATRVKAIRIINWNPYYIVRES